MLNTMKAPQGIPYAVAERLQSIADTAANQSAALRSVSAEMRELHAAVQKDEADLQRLERSGGADDQQISQLAAKIERSRADLAKLLDRIEKLSAFWNSTKRLVDTCQSYARTNAGRIMLHDGDDPQLRPGEKALAGLDRASRRARSLKMDRREIELAPYPRAEAKRKAREYLAARAQAARPDVSATLEHLQEPRFPTRVLEKLGSGSLDFVTVDVIGVMAWALPEAMQAAIDREIDLMCEGEDEIALSEQERTEKLAVIDADTLAAEREVVMFSELAGLMPPADTDPRAVLRLSDAMPAPERS
ncbi:hypothetical protein [Bradyrhizobium vignae]|uniref:hypothetical protein n=1 Tax=Bradyrhizobium vignae TaxID=1549949 RepID=UPI00100BB8C8|nr:hypothetical protein [Bradyrhizobium vignae]RXG92282.1 hypothetical protein EAV90_27240 [Bradyrhizobium vignae]